MSSIIYLIITTLTFPLWFPIVSIVLLSRGLFGKGRLGLVPKGGQGRKIWLHAASVGEVNALLPLFDKFRDSGFQIFISTMTKTGKEHLQKKCLVEFEHFYLPLDWPGFVWLALIRLKPQKIIIAETEIWPGLFFMAKVFKIPLYLVSARLSDTSIKSYKKLKFFLSSVLNCAEKVYAQSEVDKNRYLELGLLEKKLLICGNVKNEYLNQILKKPNAPIELWQSGKDKKIVFGSFRPKEAAFVANSIELLLQKDPAYKFLLCPRHFDWLESFYGDLRRKNIGFNVSSKSGLRVDNSVLIIDEMGKLLSAYSGAYAAFVGGTLFAEYGGHNMLEPAAFGLPVFHGPFYAEQRTIAEPLLRNKASVVVDSAESFVDQILDLQKDAGLYTSRRLNALRTVEQQAYPMQILLKDNLFV